MKQADSGRYARVIRESRAARGLNQQQLADLVGVSRNTVAGWETGHSRPDLDSVPALCRALGLGLARFFGIREGVSAEERRLLDLYASLEDSDRQAVGWQMEALYARRRQQRMEELRSRVVSLFRSDLSAAAGTGVLLDEASGEPVYLYRDDLTEQADEVVSVNGHSMEPTFDDGDEVLVQHADSLRVGEIGLFVVGGEGFIKEYRPDGLYSHNPAYAPMRFEEIGEARCVGRVLGRVRPDQVPGEKEQRMLEEGEKTR